MKRRVLLSCRVLVSSGWRLARIDAARRCRRHGRANPDGRAAAAPARCALYRTLTDEIGARLTGSPGPQAGGAVGARPLRGMGPRRTRISSPYEFGRGWQLEHISVEMTEPRYFPAGCVCGSLVAVDQRRRERTSRGTSATRTLRRSRRWRHSFAAPSCSRTCR